MRNKTGSVSCAALRSAQAAQTTRHDETDDARERLTSPDIPTHQTAPWSDFGKSRTRARHCRAFLAFHTDAERFTVPQKFHFFEILEIFVLIFIMTGRSCDLFDFVVIIPKQTYH